MDTFSKSVCSQVDDNQIGEKALFKDGMSVSDLQAEYATFQPYTKYKEWTTGFCFHSDWLWGYFSNYYNISQHSGDEFFKDVPQDRMEGYNQSQIFHRDDQPYHLNLRRNCDNQRTELGRNCDASSPICHYQTPRDMSRLTHLIQQSFSNKFRTNTQ
jgi:hypothetical protein